MINLVDHLRKIFHCHGPRSKKLEYDVKRYYDIPSKPKYPPNISRAFLGLDPIISVDKDKQIVKIHEGKNVIIQYDHILSEESMKQIKEDIQKQIKEHGFAVVDGRCKIVEFDNPKYLIETK